MNKLLMISNFSQISGYSYAAENNLKAIYCSGFPVVAKDIKLTPKSRQLDNVTKKLLALNSDDCNILLIHSIPSFFQYNGNFKVNIGYFAYETDLLGTNWDKYCNMMDIIWVPSKFMKDNLKQSVQRKIDVVPYPVDINRFHQSPRENWFSKYKKQTQNYLFYTISEYGSRKNIECLLKAWNSSFRHSDRADLILKFHKTGWDSAKLKNEIIELNEFIKKNLKIPNKFTKNPIVITDDWSEEQIDDLHQAGDCFVSPSHCEGWGIDTISAMCFQRPVIVSGATAFLDYVNIDNGYLINGYWERPYGNLDSLPYLYNYENKWFQPNFDHLGHIMRNLLKNPEEGVEKGKIGSKLTETLNYESIGNLSKTLLESYVGGVSDV